MIVERTQEGKAIAREKGIRVDGRPKKNVPTETLRNYYILQQKGKMTVDRIFAYGCKCTVVGAN